MKRKEQTISAGLFKAKCLQIMDEVKQQHKTITITKRGKPVAKIVPVDNQPKSLFGAMKGTVTILGDIVGPTGEIWEAEDD